MYLFLFFFVAVLAATFKVNLTFHLQSFVIIILLHATELLELYVLQVRIYLLTDIC